MNKSIIIKIIITLITSTLILYIIQTLTIKKETPKTPLKTIPPAYKTISLNKNITKHQRKEKIKSTISNKTIYLTFDDGPSYLTDKILDILEKENVPATFFVIGKHIDEYKNTIKRAYNNGHTIAIHSNTHDYKYIYSSDENYFEDLKTINNKIFNITSNKSRIVRLPGGSSNTVSKKYNSGIITRITQKLKENDYYYFDWNIDSLDASGKLAKEQIYTNVTTQIKQGENIILMHDSATKLTTYEALEDIIKYSKQNGYTFARITKNTLPIHHKIKNWHKKTNNV